MKRFLSIHNITAILFLAVFAAGFVSIAAWRNLETKIKSPDFKTQVVGELERLTGGKVQIGSLDGRLSFHPWLSFQDFSLILPENTIRFVASRLQLDLRILPLLKKEIVFSHIDMERPRLVFQRPKGGGRILTEMRLPRMNSDSKMFQIESLSIEKGRFTFINPAQSTEPILEIEADASTKASPWNKYHSLLLTGKFLTKGVAGPFDLKVDFFPNFDWKMEAHLKNPMSTVSNEPLPLRITAEVVSSGPMVLSAAWHSDLTDITAEIKAVNWREPHYTFQSNVLGGTVNGTAFCKAGPTPRSSPLLTLRARGEKLRVENFLALTISTVSWTGAFHFNLALIDFPLLTIDRLHGAGILESLSKARTANFDIGGDASFQEKSPLKEIAGTLALHPTGRTFEAGFRVNWKDGGLKGRASFPHVSRDKATGPLDVAMTIDNMDLTFLPDLAQRLDLSMANVGADIQWRTNSISRQMFEACSSDVEWSINGHFEKLIWRGIPLDNFSGRATWDRSVLRVENVHGQVSSGTFAAEGNLSGRGEQGFKNFSVNADVANVEVSPFVFTFSTNPILLDGRFSSKVKLSGDLRPFNPQTLSGVAVVSGRKGHLRSGSFMIALFSKLNLKSLFETVTGKRQKGYPFDVIAATGAIGGGRIVFEQPLAVKNSSLEIAFTGWGALDAQSGEGVVVVNPLVGTRNLLTVVPGVSTLVMGPEGEFLPLIVDVEYRQGELKTNFRSIKTLADLPLRIISNVIHLPATLFGGGKKSKPTE